MVMNLKAQSGAYEEGFINEASPCYIKAYCLSLDFPWSKNSPVKHLTAIAGMVFPKQLAKSEKKKAIMRECYLKIINNRSLTVQEINCRT